MSHYPRHVDKGSSIFDEVNDPTSPTNSVSEKVVTKNDDGTVQTVTTELSNKNNGTPKAQGKESDQTVNDSSKIYDQPTDGNIFTDLLLGKQAEALPTNAEGSPEGSPGDFEQVMKQTEQRHSAQDYQDMFTDQANPYNATLPSWLPGTDEYSRTEDGSILTAYEAKQFDGFDSWNQAQRDMAAVPLYGSVSDTVMGALEFVAPSQEFMKDTYEFVTDGAILSDVADWAKEDPLLAAGMAIYTYKGRKAIQAMPKKVQEKVEAYLKTAQGKAKAKAALKNAKKELERLNKGGTSKTAIKKIDVLERRIKKLDGEISTYGKHVVSLPSKATATKIGIGTAIGADALDIFEDEESFTDSIAADDKKKIKADAISAFKALQNDVTAVTKANTIEQDRKVAEQVANNQAQVIASEGETIGRSLIKIALGALAGVSVGAMVGSKGNQVLEDQKLARERTLQQDKYNLDMSKANAKAATKAAGERIKAKNKRWNDVKTTAFKGRVKFDDYGKPKDPGLASQITKAIAAIKLGGEEMNFTSEANLYEAIDRHQKDPKTTILGNYYSKQVLMDGSNLAVTQNEYNNRNPIEHMNSMGYIRAKLSKGGKSKSEVDAQLAGFWESFKKLQDNSDKEFEWEGRFAEYTEALLKGNIK